MERPIESASAISDLAETAGVPSAELDKLFAARYAPEATHELEASEIICRFMAARDHTNITQLLHKSGAVSTASRQQLVRKLTSDAAVVFSAVSSTHTCAAGDHLSAWKLRKIDHMRYKKGIDDAEITRHDRTRRKESVEDEGLAKQLPAGARGDLVDIERSLETTANRGCRLHHPFSAGENFTALADGNMYVATGDVYLCTGSGIVHICAEGACNRTTRMPRDEGLLCQLTGNFFKAAAVHSEPNHAARERQDGGVTLTAHGRNAGGQLTESRGWVATRTKDQREAFKLRRITFLAGHDRDETVRRARDPLSRMYYDFSTPSDCITTNGGGHTMPLVSSVLERTMRVHYPEADHPQVTPMLREQVLDVFKFLFEGGVQIVRKSQWDRTAEACQRGTAAVRAYVVNTVRKRRMPDPIIAQSMFIAEVQPQFSRFEVLGITDTTEGGGDDGDAPEVSTQEMRALRMYIQDCVIAVWIMMHYMPFAKRYTKGIPLSKHIVGIIYKLQTGFYVTRGGDEGEFVALIPRHACLDALPGKNDLNKHEYFKHRQGYNSQCVMDTGELISNCFASLLDGSIPAEEILRFQLFKYLKVWGPTSDGAGESDDGGGGGE